MDIGTGADAAQNVRLDKLEEAQERAFGELKEHTKDCAEYRKEIAKQMEAIKRILYLAAGAALVAAGEGLGILQLLQALG